jgi:hypothetical protein
MCVPPCPAHSAMNKAQPLSIKKIYIKKNFIKKLHFVQSRTAGAGVPVCRCAGGGGGQAQNSGRRPFHGTASVHSSVILNRHPRRCPVIILRINNGGGRWSG